MVLVACFEAVFGCCNVNFRVIRTHHVSLFMDNIIGFGFPGGL